MVVRACFFFRFRSPTLVACAPENEKFFLIFCRLRVEAAKDQRRTVLFRNVPPLKIETVLTLNNLELLYLTKLTTMIVF